VETETPPLDESANPARNAAEEFEIDRASLTANRRILYILLLKLIVLWVVAHGADVHEQCHTIRAVPRFINYTATRPQPPSQTSHPPSTSLLDVAFSSLTTGRLVSAASSSNEPKLVCRTVMSFLVVRATSFFAEDAVLRRLCRVVVGGGSRRWFEDVKTHTKRSLASIACL